MVEIGVGSEWREEANEIEVCREMVDCDQPRVVSMSATNDRITAEWDGADRGGSERRSRCLPRNVHEVQR